MKAVILAGGVGTRLRPLTFSKPKPLVYLAGKPILVHILDYLYENGIDHVYITTNYLRQRIESYIGEKYNKIGVATPNNIYEEILLTSNIENFSLSILSKQRIYSPEELATLNTYFRKHIPSQNWLWHWVKEPAVKP